MMKFETVIGLEVHAELSTKTKAFCSCEVCYGKEANTCCCPVCMGLPGALPQLNKQMVEYCIKLGMATNCEIANASNHARKNYFYPDLPKGYQITQGSFPLCKNGFVDIGDKKIRINRIHIEEDAGKLIHQGGVTLIDYNRAGVPLLEIVTEPDIRSCEEARVFLEKIREILIYLDISHCRMQEGNLRCDVNVSVRGKGGDKYNERCEMKNINSFSGVIRCIEYEEKRQRNIIENGGAIRRETRRWIDEEGRSEIMRDKENEADYRYFTEPDLPLIVVNDSDLDRIRNTMAELPDEKRKRYKNYALTDYECNEIIKNKVFADMLDNAVKYGGNPKRVYNLLVSDIARVINVTGKIIPFSGKELAEVSNLIENGEISSTGGKVVLETMFSENKSPYEIVKEKGLIQIDNKAHIEQFVKAVLEKNPKSVADYKKGKTNALGFLVGQCMRLSENKANPKIVTEVLKKELDK